MAITLRAFVALLLLVSFADASAYVIKGRVTAYYDGMPLSGASVSVVGNSAVGTVTDSDGRFTINLPGNAPAQLSVSYIGYTPASVSVDPKMTDTPLNIRLGESAVNLDAVVVTATRTPKLLKDTPIITRLLTTADIKRSDATNIGDLLESELPGVEFSYSMNQQTALNMQGFGGNSVLFLVDGERLAGETLDNIDYSRLNLDNVERVEIVKGAASSLYGSNAVGGVVNLISRTPRSPWGVNLDARIGAHSDQRYGAAISFKTRRLNSVTNIQHTFVDSIRLTDGNPDKGDYSMIYGHQTWNIKERLQFEPVKDLKLTARAGYFFRQRDSQPSLRERYRDFSAGLSGDYTFRTGSTLNVAYTFDQYDKSDYYRMSGNDIRDYSNVQHSVRSIFSHTWAEKFTFTGGGDIMRDYLMTYQFADNGSKRQYTADLFAQADLNITERFNVVTGLRYDYFSEAAVDHLSAKAGVKYKLDPIILRGSYAGGFRAPTLKEMYMDFNMANIFMIYGNPDLKPETSHNFSISGEYAKGRYDFTLNGFFNMVDSRITTAWNTALRGQQYVNMAPLRTAGAEVNAVIKFPFGMGTRFSYAYTHEHIRKGEPLTSSTRPHTATVRINYGRSFRNYGFDIALNGRVLSAVTVGEYTSVSSYEDTERVTYPAYTMWKLLLSQDIWRGITLNITVDNLFNYRPSYYFSNSPSTTGTTLSAGISLDLEKMIKK